VIAAAYAAVVLAAALIVLQGQLNGALQLRIGLLGTIFWAHFVVTVLVLPVVLYYHSEIVACISGRLPKDNGYRLLIGGTFGIVIVPALAFAIPAVGLKNAFFCLVVMQVLFSLAFEHIGQGTGIGLREVAGVILLAISGWLIIFR
jgi:uncharacterized membrane protein YdcZ (DUF606 family)